MSVIQMRVRNEWWRLFMFPFEICNPLPKRSVLNVSRIVVLFVMFLCVYLLFANSPLSYPYPKAIREGGLEKILAQVFGKKY